MRKIPEDMMIGIVHYSNNGEECKVIDYLDSRSVQVRFENDEIKLLDARDLRRGEFASDKGKIPKDLIPGTIFTSNAGEKFEIINYEGAFKIRIKFLNGGFEKVTTSSVVRVGNIKNPYEISAAGVGYIGEPNRKLNYYKNAMKLWHALLTRCYTNKHVASEDYKSARVSERWFCFEHFLNDLQLLPRFERWKNGEAMDLDKELINSERVYSVDNCCFLTRKENLIARNQEQVKKFRCKLANGAIRW